MNNIFDNAEDLMSFLKKESDSNLFIEICGFFGKTEDGKFIYVKAPNRAKDPSNYFVIDPYDYLCFINKYKCLGVFHSHILGSEKASDFDITCSENLCYSFLIYSIETELFHLYEPENKDYDVKDIEDIKNKIL